MDLVVQENNLSVSGLAGFLHFCNKCHFEIKIAISIKYLKLLCEE